MNVADQPSRWKRSAPALLLMLAAPMFAEVLPGATRFSSLFVLPIEICVWGGGALLIREVVRRRQLGWGSLMFLALALAAAEECLIQQTSLAPLVIQLKGQVYARAFGVNYVYLLWALVYEAVFVVFLPVHVVELTFPQRQREGWVNRGGLAAVVLFFLIGCFLAWFSWTQIARIKVFHLPAFTPPLVAMASAVLAIVALIAAALGSSRERSSPSSTPWTPPSPWLVGLTGAIWGVLWYGLVVLGFGAMPTFPPAAAIAGGLLLAVLALLLPARWSVSPAWRPRHLFAVVFGPIAGTMLVSFIGFLGTASWDLYFKIIVDVVAAIILTMLGIRVSRAGRQSPLAQSS